MKRRLNNVFSILVILNCITACTIERAAEPIIYGKDQCAFCKMTISNPQFGAELVTDKGRILKYDALECMVNHLNKDAPAYQKLYAVPYDKPKELRELGDLYFLISPDFRSPMGANLAAFSDKNSIEQKYHSLLINWQVLKDSL